MRTGPRTLAARLAAADPARDLEIDAAARLELWRRIAAQPPVAAPAGRLGRVRARLRRPLLLIPAIAALGAGALGTEPAWCAPCQGGHAHAALAPARAAAPVPAARPAAPIDLRGRH